MIFWNIADTHLGHDAIREYCGRPDDHEERIIYGIRRIVAPEDVLIHHGDVCMYKEEFWHRLVREACAGKMWLILGNHDKKSMTWYLDKGWDFVGTEVLLVMYGKRILLTHEPKEEGDFDINVHGHLHNTGHRPGGRSEKHRLIYLEHHYQPQNLRRIIGC